MFGLRWHDLYGMCVLRPHDPYEADPRRAAAGAGYPPGRYLVWWRVSSYYGLGWEAGQG